MQTATLTVASKPAVRGFPSLPCLLCGNADGNVAVALEDLSQFHCNECGEDFDADAVREQIAAWSRVLAWIGSAPVVE